MRKMIVAALALSLFAAVAHAAPPKTSKDLSSYVFKGKTLADVEKDLGKSFKLFYSDSDIKRYHAVFSVTYDPNLPPRDETVEVGIKQGVIVVAGIKSGRN